MQEEKDSGFDHLFGRYYSHTYNMEKGKMRFIYEWGRPIFKCDKVAISRKTPFSTYAEKDNFILDMTDL